MYIPNVHAYTHIHTRQKMEFTRCMIGGVPYTQNKKFRFLYSARYIRVATAQLE